MKTLEQLIKELGIKPTLMEIKCGRLKTRNGYSYVYVNNNNEYFTLSEKRPHQFHKEYLVRGK